MQNESIAKYAANQLLSRAEAAARLGVAVSTLEAWAHRGTPRLPYTRIGKLAKYRAADIENFLNQNTGTSATEISQAQVALAAQSA